MVTSRAVSEEMQERFARLSGDRNPMHMDPVIARRTQAGQPVVHGMHTLLWSLESLVGAALISVPLRRVRVKFLRWVYLHDLAVLSVGDVGLNPQTFQVEVQGLPLLSAVLEYGETPGPAVHDESRLAPRTVPLELSFAEMNGRSGEAYVASAPAVREMFPRLSELLGTRCVAEMAACSYIVGMEAPGMHSALSKVDLTFCAGATRAGLGYKVTYLDERFRKARLQATGSAIDGILDVFVRVPPVTQATMQEVARAVEPGEFAGMRALIIGGSRGLGEVTAKIVAAGSGDAVISYAVGNADAEHVAESIRAFGGRAETLTYDVRKSPVGQLSGIGAAPSHLFYFATNAIFRPKYELLSETNLSEFLQFYVLGFYDLCKALTSAPDAPRKLIAYYPSSVAMEDRPAGMTEYTMAKAAGEVLCADMNSYLPNLHVLVSRLPRLPTDQTAGLIPERETRPLDTLIPLVREMKRLAVERS